jgi:hypothetical protein
MTNIGIKISKPGVDVTAATNDELVWSSDFKTFKIFKILRFTTSGNVSHGLDYAPAFIAYRAVSTPVADSWVCVQRGYQLGGRGAIQVDDENVYCYDSSEVIYVILFIDPLDE